MKRLIPWFVGLSGVFFALAVMANLPSSRPNELMPEEVLERQATGSALIIDVRTPREYEASHVEGAYLIPLSQVSRRANEIAQFAEGREIVLYCRTGRRAGIAEDILRDHGITAIYHLHGQLSGWRAAGLPVGTGIEG